MRIPGLSNALVAADHLMDYIPFIGIVNNVVDVALKALLYFVPEGKKEKVRYFRHLDQKSLGTAALSAIPFVGTLAKVVQLFRTSKPVENKNLYARADAGDTEAMKDLVERFASEGDSQDLVEAEYWLKKAIAGGDKQVDLELFYKETKQWSKAVDHVKKSGDTKRICKLGWELGPEGDDVLPFVRQCFECSLTEETDSLEGLVEVAKRYDELKKYAEALPCWEKAAQLKNEEAKGRLLVAYGRGEYGAKKDFVKALSYCVKANDAWALCIDFLEDQTTPTKDKLAAARYLYTSPLADPNEKTKYGYAAAKYGDATIPALTVFAFAEDKVARKQAELQREKHPTTAGYLYAMMVDLGLGGVFDSHQKGSPFATLKERPTAEVAELLLNVYKETSDNHPNDIVGVRARERLPFIQTLAPKE